MISQRYRFHPNLRTGVWLLLVLALTAPCPVLAAAKVKASTGTLTLPTYPWAAVKHPYFRGTDKVNIYPYPMLDFLSREKTNRTYRTVVLENEYLQITFLPELGGKIHEVIDKTTGQPMFYVNHVIKPGLIGQCGAWTSGGVEWNTGPQGHTVGCMQPVPVEILPPERDGSCSVAIGETERIYGTKWTVIVTLRPGRSFIEERIRIYNPTETIRPYYFWNCTAVPNTPGFRFIYPMTLGTDHGSEKFFNWPIHEGKDLSRGTNYQDASSIFAWHCDQDFFGSYDDGVDRGVVSYANHHQVPGKKAWTWGQGGFGKMHQMDLTDSDGPYNEVQTGPLLTQGEVGRLDPCEAVEWQEWWYPVHGIGGFTFANRHVAVNATIDQGRLRLRMIGSGSWSPVSVVVAKGTAVVTRARCQLTSREPADLRLDLGGASEPLEIQLSAGAEALATFRVPLDLPVRKPPEKKAQPETATELVQAGWQEYLFARFPEAERQFRKALEKDAKSVSARTGLAYLNLDRDPAKAAEETRAALAIDPDSGLARFALAVAECRAGNETAALDAAWNASLDPLTAVPGRALVAKLLLRRGDWAGVVQALTATGPWQADSVCRNRLAIADVELGRQAVAVELAERNLRENPLDGLAASVLRTARIALKSAPKSSLPLIYTPEAALEVVADYAELGQIRKARTLGFNSMPEVTATLDAASIWRSSPLMYYWMDYLTAKMTAQSRPNPARSVDAPMLRYADKLPGMEAFPHRFQELLPLRWAVQVQPSDGKTALYLGHLLFRLGRHAEGREMWKRAAALGAEPVIAYRALGMAALTLDNDAETATKYLTQANEADRTDAIVARDLAKVLFTQAEKADSAERKKELLARARDTLEAAFAQGKGRSDFVSLLGRAQNRLGEYAATARMLDQVRVTVWEGSREVHDLFEDAHLALGEAQLKAGRAAEALAEFNRALEYPENLATGKLENDRQAHVQYLRGNAFAALGQTQAALEAWKTAANEAPSKDEQKEAARKQAQEALTKAGAPHGR